MNRAMVLIVMLGAAGIQSATAAIVEVTTSGNSFVASEITIDVGDTVRWTNLQPGFHNVAEVDEADWNTNTNNPNGGFFSGVPGAVNEFEFTFNDAGTFFYICQEHISMSMKGKVIVVPPVPALTVWSIAMLAAALIGAGAIMLRRRLRTA